ncbi:hypothetical protein FF38_07277, partial [Lucilia cuprina]
AADVIEGGVKVNALPEKVELKINHRISVDSNVAAIRERLEKFTYELAQQFNLGLESEGKTLIERTNNGYFNITAIRPLEPSPVSPSSGLPWDLISGTTQNVYANLPSGPSEKLYIAPFLFPANTDTRHYWNLTRAIYRYNPILAEDSLDIHTVNEPSVAECDADTQEAPKFVSRNAPGYVLSAQSPQKLGIDRVNQTSGYLQTPTGDELFYFFFESRGNPSKDPVLVWLNGGPGCSSLQAILFENGPSNMVNGQLSNNTWSWNNNANVLYIDNP